MAKHRDPFRMRDGVLAALLLILAAYSIVDSQLLRAEQRRQGECIESFVSDDSEISKSRSKASTLNFDAIDTIIQNIFAAETPEEGRAAKKEYDETMTKVRATRAANPIKTFDPEKCGEKK